MPFMGYTVCEGGVLFDPVEHEVRGDDQPLLVGRVGQLGGQARRLRAVLARQEARLLQPARLVHQLVRLLHVARLLEPPHDHRVQFWILEQIIHKTLFNIPRRGAEHKGSVGCNNRIYLFMVCMSP